MSMLRCPSSFLLQGKFGSSIKAFTSQLLPPHEGQTRNLGFAQSIADLCLFTFPTVICLIYVDDALLVYRDQQAVDKLAHDMK